jgi:hypothetical protein
MKAGIDYKKVAPIAYAAMHGLEPPDATAQSVD